MKKINFLTPELKLVSLTFIILLIFKIVYIKDFLLIFKTSLYDVSFLLIFYFFFLISRKLFLRIIIYVIYFFNFLILSFYYLYFYDVSQRAISLTNVSFEVLSFTLKNILSPKLFLIIIFSFLIVILLSIFIFRKRKIFFSKKYVYFILFFSIFLIFILFFIFKITYNPYLSSLESYNLRQKSILLEESSYFSEKFINDKTFSSFPKENLKYKKVLVFIGEEWMFSEYDLISEKINKNNFYKKNKPNTHNYTNLYTTNQDSRTSIYSMLTGYFIPFEAYLDSTFSLYYPVIEDKSSIVDFFKNNNYNSYFLVSSLEVPDISYPFKWTDVITLDQEVYDSKKYYCLDIFTYESACEDLSVIDSLKKIILENEYLFLYQEFIYGHSNRYIIDNRLSRTEYYNIYFNEVYDFLKEENLLNETLIIITADHGSRARNAMLYPDGYNVPFLVVSDDLEYMEDERLLSHLDFNDIIFKYLLGIDNVKENNSVMFVGSTNSNLFGFVTYDDTFGIIDVSSKKLINYSLNNDSIKNISQEHYSFYNFLKENFK